METIPGPAEPHATRLPPSTRPGPVRLQVADLSRSLAWYGDVLGMPVVESGPGWARLGAHGESSVSGGHLVELVERPGAAPVPRRGHLGLYHVAIFLPDRGALGRFVAHLGRLRIPAGSADHLVSEALYLNDPDGLGFEVYADRPPSSWARTPTGEIAMASEPLALDDLARAGGDDDWGGLPRGSRVGHLHLHVGSLEGAERFYAASLGLDVQVRSYPGALFLSAGGYHHHLGVNTWARGAVAAGPNDARLLSWSLVLPTPRAVESALTRLEEAGHTITRAEPGVGQLPDPWGTELRILSDSGSGSGSGPEPGSGGADVGAPPS